MSNLNDLIKRGRKIFSMGIETGNKYYFEESIEIYMEVLKELPDLSPVLTDLGVALNKTGNQKKAIEAYSQSLKCNKYNSDKLKSITLYNRGLANHLMENDEAALKDYKKSIELDKNNYRPYNAIGALENESKNYIDAIEKYKDALMLCDNDDISKKIKKNIKNSNKNMSLFLNILAYDSIKESYNIHNQN